MCLLHLMVGSSLLRFMFTDSNCRDCEYHDMCCRMMWNPTEIFGSALNLLQVETIIFPTTTNCTTLHTIWPYDHMFGQTHIQLSEMANRQRLQWMILFGGASKGQRKAWVRDQDFTKVGAVRLGWGNVQIWSKFWLNRVSDPKSNSLGIMYNYCYIRVATSMECQWI